MAGKVKKHQIALFLNFGTAQAPKYVRIKKSTELTLNFDPQTEDYDYIADESPTTDLERYAPKIEGLPLTMYKGEPDFDALWEYAYNLKTGGDSTTDMLLVYKFDEDAKTTGQWKAWKAGCAVVIKQLNAVDGTLEVDFPMRGTILRGTVKQGTDDAPTFTAAGGSI